MSVRGATEPLVDDGDRLAFGMGRIEILDNERAGYGILEYRDDARLGRFELGPWMSLETSGREFYAATGLFRDVELGEKWVFTPSLGVGLYFEDDGLDLGSHIEFRSAVELSYRFHNDGRVGVSFGHMSNARLGAANPGTEFLRLQVSIPMGFTPH